MKRSVQIRIESQSEGEDIVQEVSGELFNKAESVYVRYAEPDASSMGNTMTTVKLSLDEIKVIRHGDVTSDQSFILNKQRTGTYQTGQGQLLLETKTHRLDIQLDSGTGTVRWNYDLVVAGEHVGNFTISLYIQEQHG